MSILPLNFDGMSREINILPLFKLVGEHLLIPFDYVQPLLSHLALVQGFTLSQRMVITLLFFVGVALQLQLFPIQG